MSLDNKKNRLIGSGKLELNVRKNIRYLMDEAGMIEAELARQTGIPQTTINRVLLGETLDPRATTLVSISKFFGVTVDQLIGHLPFNKNPIEGAYHPTNKVAWSMIPIVDWDIVRAWVFQREKFIPSSHNDWITTERGVSELSFALRTLPQMEPRFKKGSTIIVDPKQKYKDGNFVVVSCNGATPTVRKITLDGDDVYFSRLYSSDNPSLKQKMDEIIGTIVETRINES
ncbi:MAG: LexA family transcriptional regulator [Legionellales bacterium]|nr:LexA family transcriptional regulator [Legionellales bacterium]